MDVTDSQLKALPGAVSDEESAREREHREETRRIAAEGIVLLKNGGMLPLARDCSPALYGGGALHLVTGGTGSGSVNVRKSVSVAEGLRKAGVRIANEQWLADYEDAYAKAEVEWRELVYREAGDRNDFFKLYHAHASHPMVMPMGEAVTEDSKADTDTAIFVVSRVSGEGADRTESRGDYFLSEAEETQLAGICGAYSHVAVVLNIGGIMDLSFMDRYPVEALVLLSQPGMAGGDALADVLTGKVNPSGCLTDTWAYRYSDYPFSEHFSHNDGNLEQEFYREGIYVGYRWFDSQDITPRFPFGYGLSYTSFAEEPELTTAPGEAGNDEQVTVAVRVTNTGHVPGRHVVQLYAACPVGNIHKERRRLVAFGKTKLLAPGDTQTLRISFPFRALASFDVDSYVLERGDYILMCGSNIRDAKVCAALTLPSDVRYGECERVCPLVDELTETVPSGAAHEAWREKLLADAGEIDKIALDADAVRACVERNLRPEIPVTDADRKAEELVSKLTSREKAMLVCGRPSQGSAEFIGSAGVSVPGAAGETSNVLAGAGVPGISMADGPAGLRLQAKCEFDPETGELYAMNAIQRLENRMFKTEFPHEGAVVRYQYCTAIPVGTLLAQTFDTEVVAEAGRLVGREMEEFHAPLWLAPGMNIHRNPLCGRNFEYFSEDPVLSGLIAAAITDGVQSVPGKGVTIKHFACNNQEENRGGVSAVIGERALREIYLKGFEIAIRKSQPSAIMTSYNLVNGVHSANCADLCTTVAREEWGFAGLIMTDWGTTNTMGNATAWGCVAAGNDLTMPGTEEDILNVLAALESGELSPDALDKCAARVVSAMLRLH